MRRYFPVLLVLISLAFSISCYSQKDSIAGNKSERKVIINPNPFKDSAQISITGIYHLSSMRISIMGRNGHAVLEFVPRQIPYLLKKGDLSPGLYYVRCVDKYGRIPTKKMKILGEPLAEPE
jgi:hypothetical protein